MGKRKKLPREIIFDDLIEDTIHGRVNAGDGYY